MLGEQVGLYLKTQLFRQPGEVRSTTWVTEHSLVACLAFIMRDSSAIWDTGLKEHHAEQGLENAFIEDGLVCFWPASVFLNLIQKATGGIAAVGELREVENMQLRSGSLVGCNRGTDQPGVSRSISNQSWQLAERAPEWPLWVKITWACWCCGGKTYITKSG